MAKHTKKEKAASQPEKQSAPQEKSLLLPILIWALCFVAFCDFIIGAYLYTSYQSAQKQAEEQRLYAQSAASQTYTPPTADQIWGTQPPSPSQEAEPDKTDAEAMPPQDLQSQLLAQQTEIIGEAGEIDVTQTVTPAVPEPTSPTAIDEGTEIPAQPITVTPIGGKPSVPQNTTGSKRTTGIPASAQILSDDTIVYVSNSADKIHSISNCSGMKYYRSMTLGEANANNYEYCTNCWS